MSLGIRQIAIPKRLRDDPFWKRSLEKIYTKAQPERFVCILDCEDEEDKDDEWWDSWELPRLTFIDPSFCGETLSEHLLYQTNQMHIVILPEDMRDPGNSSRCVGDVTPPNSMSILAFKSNLNL